MIKNVIIGTNHCRECLKYKNEPTYIDYDSLDQDGKDYVSRICIETGISSFPLVFNAEGTIDVLV